MKVILLAGGLGTRLAEFTDVIPKPMVPIGDHPVLWHLMKYYASFGHHDFHVALGYKATVVKEYFLNYHALNSDFTVNLGTGAAALSDGRQGEADEGVSRRRTILIDLRRWFVQRGYQCPRRVS